MNCHDELVVRNNYNNMLRCIAVFGYNPVRNLSLVMLQCRYASKKAEVATQQQARPWCVSGGIDHCYDWGVQTHWTIRGRVALELFELSGLHFAEVWGKPEGGGSRTLDDKSPDMSVEELPLLPVCTVGITERCFVQLFLERSKHIWQESLVLISLMLIQCNMILVSVMALCFVSALSI